jgi:hypothetical protein
MLVASNTSPIFNLAIIGRLELLKTRYEIVHIPHAVEKELAALSHPSAKTSIQAAFAERWLRINELKEPFEAKIALSLDAGETAAIELAMQIKAQRLLIDEKPGREAARRLGLSVSGVLGELLHAKNARWIFSVRVEINRLRNEAGFFIDAEIEKFILSQAGE